MFAIHILVSNLISANASFSFGIFLASIKHDLNSMMFAIHILVSNLISANAFFSFGIFLASIKHDLNS